MTYDFYCTSCGNKLRPHEVVFNLVPILGIDEIETDKSGLKKKIDMGIYITPDDLKFLLKRSGNEAGYNERSLIKMSMEDLLKYLCRDRSVSNEVQAEVQNLLGENKIDDAIDTLLSVLSQNVSQQNEENMIRFTRQLKTEIKNRFVEEMDEKTGIKYYVFSFWIEMEYFDDCKKEELYTFRYTLDENAANLKYQTYGGEIEIRGLCPLCHQPLVKHAGRYRHVPIGFVGKSSAGKTSLMVSMTQYMTSCDMNDENFTVLNDGKYKILYYYCEAFKNGWGVYKTSKVTSDDSLNISFLAEKQDHYCILTFVDIAGELLWGEKEDIDPKAFEMYPLITSCKAYILCACITSSGYINPVDGQTGRSNELTNENLTKILNEIYEHRKDKISVPPLAILLTKLDLVEDAAGNIGKDRRKTEIFNDLAFRRCRYYEKNIEKLNVIYSYGNSEVCESLNWCFSVYKIFSTKTYVTLLWCTPLGKFTKSCSYKIGEKIEPCLIKNKRVVFEPKNRDSLLSWIMCTIGMSSPKAGVGEKDSGKVFIHIPSFKESYRRQNGKEGGLPFIRQIYPIEAAEERLQLIERQFLNISELDKAMAAIYRGCCADVEINLFRRLFNRFRKDKQIGNILDQWEQTGNIKGGTRHGIKGLFGAHKSR